MDTLERIFYLLNLKGYESKDLAKALKLANSAISSWKSGVTTSYKKKLPEIADFLETSVAYLSCETDDPSPVQNNAPATVDEGIAIARRLLEQFQIVKPGEDLSKEQLNSILSFIESNRDTFRILIDKTK